MIRSMRGWRRVNPWPWRLLRSRFPIRRAPASTTMRRLAGMPLRRGAYSPRLLLVAQRIPGLIRLMCKMALAFTCATRPRLILERSCILIRDRYWRTVFLVLGEASTTCRHSPVTFLSASGAYGQLNHEKTTYDRRDGACASHRRARTCAEL